MLVADGFSCLTNFKSEMIRLITTEKSRIEGDSIRQLEKVAELPGMVTTVGLPDLHAGPVGMAAASQEIIHPRLIGNDVGCGMGFWQADLPLRKLKPDKIAGKLTGLDSPHEFESGEKEALFEKYALNEKGTESLGTIGGGNHFAELQAVESVENESLFSEAGLDKNKPFLLVHSGSRGFGKQVMDWYVENLSGHELRGDSDPGREYLEKHDYAVRLAKAGREIIARRFLNKLRAEGKLVSDVVHNSLTQETFSSGNMWVHRKGASANNRGFCVVAGSRGSLSYFVKPVGNLEKTNYSIAHGAGRKLKRREMHARLKNRFSASDLRRTALGSLVICEDKKLLYEEAPDAYKKIEQVIDDLLQHGMIEVISTLKPIVTYKTGGKKWN